MKRLFFALTLIMIIPGLSAQVATPEPCMPDTGRIMKILRETPAYQPYIVPGSDAEVTDDQILFRADIFLPQEHMVYGMYYQKTSVIDTVEEYCLAEFLLGKKLPFAKIQKAFDEEFPAGAEGHLRLASLWQRIYAEDIAKTNKAMTNLADAYDKAVAVFTTDLFQRQWIHKSARMYFLRGGYRPYHEGLFLEHSII